MNERARSQASLGSRDIAAEDDRIRVRAGDVVRLLASWVITFLALLLTAKLLPGFTTRRGARCWSQRPSPVSSA